MGIFLDLSLNGLFNGALYALVAIAIVLVFKATQVVSLAHGQLLSFGALFFWFTYVAFGLPLWLSLLIALVCGGLLGFTVERLCLRPLIGQPLFSSFLMTFAIFMFFDGIFQLILKGQALGFPDFLPKGIIAVNSTKIFVGNLWSFGICLGVFLLIMLVFKYTKVGLGMRATAESHKLAQSAGISVRRIFSLTWIMSACIAVIAGITLARVMDICFYLPWGMIKGFIVAMVGGLDSLIGAVVAGLLLGWLEGMIAGYVDPFIGGAIKDVAAYVILLIILLVRPYGLFGLVKIERV